jgi:hypothetical protein
MKKKITSIIFIIIMITILFAMVGCVNPGMQAVYDYLSTHATFVNLNNSYAFITRNPVSSGDWWYIVRFNTSGELNQVGPVTYQTATQWIDNILSQGWSRIAITSVPFWLINIVCSQIAWYIGTLPLSESLFLFIIWDSNMQRLLTTKVTLAPSDCQGPMSYADPQCASIYATQNAQGGNQHSSSIDQTPQPGYPPPSTLTPVPILTPTPKHDRH